jgi:hypothetical protein
MFESGGSDANTYYYNNVCFGRQEISVGTDDYNALATSHSKLAWTNHLVTSFSRSDYVSLSEADAIAPRRGDGSMPSRFARLLPGSNLVDAGCEVPSSVTPNLAQLLADFPFLAVNVSGTARDLGPYELPQSDDTTTSLTQVIVNPEKNGSIDVIAGNSANERIVRFSVPNNVLDAELTLFDISGRMIQRIPLTRLSSGAEYYQPLEMPEGNGLYVVRLTAGTYSVSAKFTR